MNWWITFAIVLATLTGALSGMGIPTPEDYKVTGLNKYGAKGTKVFR